MDTRITRRQYARAVLVGAIESHPRPVALNVLVAQMYAESGPARCDGIDGAAYNPLNTTLPTAGSQAKPWNDVPVQNYQTIADGIAATIATLRQTNFMAVRAALATEGMTGDDTADVIAASPWGTGPLLKKVLAAFRHDPDKYELIRVGPVTK